jgi:hypothetical protein
MSNSDSVLFFIKCIIVPIVIPAFALGWWLGMRYAIYGFPKMFLPRWLQEML